MLTRHSIVAPNTTFLYNFFHTYNMNKHVPKCPKSPDGIHHINMSNETLEREKMMNKANDKGVYVTGSFLEENEDDYKCTYCGYYVW